MYHREVSRRDLVREDITSLFLVLAVLHVCNSLPTHANYSYSGAYDLAINLITAFVTLFVHPVNKQL